MNLSIMVTSHLPADCLTSIVGNQPQSVSQHRHMGELMIQKTPSHGERPTANALEKRSNNMKMSIPSFFLPMASNTKAEDAVGTGSTHTLLIQFH